MLMIKVIIAALITLGTISAYAATPPELPRVYVDTSMPTTSITKTVCNSGCNYTNDQLQQAIDDAQLGTTILLQAGATYTPLDDRGFLLKNKTSGSGWIIIRTSAPDSALPPPGTRLTPSYANVLPKIVRSSVGLYALSCDVSAHHYRIIGVEFMNPGNVDTARGGAAFVACNAALETSLVMQSHHIIFDRIYMHGPPAAGAVGVKFGIVFGGQHEGVIDSTIEELVSDDGESKAIASWSGAGPMIIRNNFLAAAGENIMIGGATPVVAGVTPADIEVRHNYFYKPLKWRDDPAYTTATPKISTKNLFELKNAQRVLIEGNVFENVWPDAQAGYALMLTPRDGGSTGSDSWTIITDVIVRSNLLKNCANGVAISGGGPTIALSQGGPTQHGGRFLVENNLIVGLGGDYTSGAPSGNFAILVLGPSDVQFQHNTVASYAGTTMRGTTLTFNYGIDNEGGLFPLQNFVLQNNILHGRVYVIALGQTSDLGTLMPGYIWTNDVVVGPWPTSGGWDISNPILPKGNGNDYPSGEANIGYVNLASGDYHLSATSPYRNAASDGKDIGVDWTVFDAQQDPANLATPVPSTTTTTSTSGSTTTTTTTSTSTATTTSPITTTTTSTDTTTSSTKRFLGKLKQLMDKVR